MFLQLILVAALTFLIYIYKLFRDNQNYWLSKGVQYEKTGYSVGQRKHLADYLNDLYKCYKQHGFLGIFVIFQPSLLVFDLNLIKQIFIGDFEYFPDRGFYTNVHSDPLSLNILRLKGEQWKALRSKITPIFSSAKMKSMFHTVVNIAEHLADITNQQIQSENDAIEVRDLCARYTTDVIGSIAFGIDCNSLENPNAKFRLMGDKAFRCFNPIIESLAINYEKILNFFGFKAFSNELIQFYTKIIEENIEYRLKNDIKRNDFFDILIELMNVTDTDGNAMLTLNEVIGQAFVFFIGGFDTSSSTMSFCLYELSQNPCIQQKVRDDVQQALAKHNYNLTYECLKEMHYLEKVVNETLRKYPIAPTLRRITRKSYQIPNTTIILPVGLPVIIPVYALHHDPQYYTEPEKFQPERFDAEEVQKRPAMTYLPFGAGPRNCIAERFGRMQTMIGLATLIKSYQFEPTPSTPKQIEFDIKILRTLSAKGGLHLCIKNL